jgi:hypothetical protein
MRQSAGARAFRYAGFPSITEWKGATRSGASNEPRKIVVPFQVFQRAALGYVVVLQFSDCSPHQRRKQCKQIDENF